MKTYKTIKEFGCAKKGDIFSENEKGYYEMGNISECVDVYSSRTMSISPDVVSTLVRAGYLEEVEELQGINYAEEKLNSISNLISEMKKQYEEDHENLLAEYNEGNVPQCVKVEADTVYFNMNKILTKIEELINE